MSQEKNTKTLKNLFGAKEGSYFASMASKLGIPNMSSLQFYGRQFCQWLHNEEHGNVNGFI